MPQRGGHDRSNVLSGDPRSCRHWVSVVRCLRLRGHGEGDVEDDGLEGELFSHLRAPVKNAGRRPPDECFGKAPCGNGERPAALADCGCRDSSGLRRFLSLTDLGEKERASPATYVSTVTLRSFPQIGQPRGRWDPSIEC